MSKWRKVCICELNENGDKGLERYAVISNDGQAITRQFNTINELNEALEKLEQHPVILQMRERNRKLMERMRDDNGTV